MERNISLEPTIVVDDIFGKFSTVSDQVKTFSELCSEIQSGTCPDSKVVCSAGIDAYRVSTMKSYLDEQERKSPVKLEYETSIANRRDVHKYEQSNVLLGPVTRTGDSYQAPFVLSSRNELIIDHQTGIHIQGMVGIEACRQMALCICESVAKRAGMQHPSISLSKYDLEFGTFLFPLPSTVVGRISSAEEDDRGWIHLYMELGVEQSGKMPVTAQMKCILIPRDVMEAIEIRRADKAIEAYLANRVETD